MRKMLLLALAFCLASTTAFASMNISYVNTTVILNRSTSARVVEAVLINISNSSVSQYLQDRQAINLTIGGWGAVLHTKSLVQNVFSPNSSIANFTLLPGPIINRGAQGAQAFLTLSYIAFNITTVDNVGPRKFDYVFNSQSLNFEHTAGGEALAQNYRLNIIIPKGTQEVSIYPEPDYPYPNALGTYNNATLFSWYEAEPLSKFAFSYLVTESLQDEVTSYFANVYRQYTQQIYLLVIIFASILSVYIYVKVFS